MLLGAVMYKAGQSPLSVNHTNFAANKIGVQLDILCSQSCDTSDTSDTYVVCAMDWFLFQLRNNGTTPHILQTPGSFLCLLYIDQMGGWPL